MGNVKERTEGRKEEWETLTVVAENTQKKRKSAPEEKDKQQDEKRQRTQSGWGQLSDTEEVVRVTDPGHTKTDREDKSRAEVRESTTAKPVHN